jgi:hypothetical protein
MRVNTAQMRFSARGSGSLPVSGQFFLNLMRWRAWATLSQLRRPIGWAAIGDLQQNTVRSFGKFIAL